ncbi:MAG: hypothetical protein SVK08_13605, partial [Halobacteriota archaeon]|nr:hypothetical protein [Halobacteriota archaeon]
ESMELGAKLIEGIMIVVDSLLNSLSIQAIFDIITIVALAIEPLMYGIYDIAMNIGGVLLNSGYDSVNGTNVTPGDPGTPLGALLELFDYSFPQGTSDVIFGNGSSGVSYMYRAMTYVFENEASYNFVASRFIYTIFEFLTWIVELIASIMQNIPAIIS